MEINAEDDVSASHLGFLTMLNDYNAELAWQFQDIAAEPKQVAVTTMVRLII